MVGDQGPELLQRRFVKGLEFDHVIIANLSKLTDPRILYVAMSRARKSVTVVGSSTRVMMSNEQPRRREE